MGGNFGHLSDSEYNFVQGGEYTQTFFHLWPEDVDMMFSPGEVGHQVHYQPEQVISDISWTDRHPIKHSSLHLQATAATSFQATMHGLQPNLIISAK